MEVALHNVTESIVLKKMDELRNSLNCCNCTQCRLDIASYALNRLPAKYVVSTQGELLSRLEALDTQFDMNVTTVILQGAMMVKLRPRHKGVEPASNQ
ncbi:MAG: late competence development ComFB family protein [Lachnospiraceae bacterium]|nr:late competence development ComFB family protein [Lachnospiraceae bacterium]